MAKRYKGINNAVTKILEEEIMNDVNKITLEPEKLNGYNDSVNIADDVIIKEEKIMSEEVVEEVVEPIQEEVIITEPEMVEPVQEEVVIAEPEVEVETVQEEVVIAEPEVEVTEECNVITGASHPPIIVNIAFTKSVEPISYQMVSNQERGKVNTSSGKLRLIHGRFYYIPVDTTIDSDEYHNIKVYSDVATIMDVKYIKDGYACILPMTHNVIIEHGLRLCTLF